jgi:hypothetical protein
MGAPPAGKERKFLKERTWRKERASAAARIPTSLDNQPLLVQR